MAESGVRGWDPVTLMAWAPNHGVWARPTASTTSINRAVAPPSHSRRLRPWLRRMATRRCRIRGSMVRRA